MNQQIELIIDKTGSCLVEVNGMTGPDCKQASRALEKALGSTMGSVPKPEFYEQQPQQNQAYQ